MRETSLDLLARWLHRDDEQVGRRLAIATRAGDAWNELTYGDLTGARRASPGAWPRRG